MRMLSRSTQLCRLTCSYWPVVQRLTKILGFLYCGCETVINLSGEGHLKNGGWGYGGVWLGVEFDTSGKFAAYEGVVSILQGEVNQSWSPNMNSQLD